MPPTLLSLPSVKEMYANEYEIFTVNFLSSFKSDTTITWLINNNLLQPNQRIISTQFQETNLTVGNTSLEFLQLNRSDNGRYTIVLHNNRTLIPIQRRNVNTSFTVNVYGKQPSSSCSQEQQWTKHIASYIDYN